MKTRITLTIDPAISHLAKQWARSRGTSVSGLVEQLLREKISQGPAAHESESFTTRWTGKAKLAQRSDVRSKRLRGKCGA